MGLKHIQNWKQLDHKSEDLGKIEQTFLENCAFQCYEIKDNNSMMKFIKAFHTIDSVRCFLKKFNCFDELLLVEEEFGNFIEASEIANCKGDILREAELLGKANKFKEASMLMLWYVFANSLWVFNSTGWPLKPFSGTEEILAKAILIAEKESESDSYLEFISTEVNLLRQEEIDVSQLNNYLNISRINNSLRGEFLSIRKILDIHLHKRASKYEWEEELLGEDLVNLCEDKLSRNCVSIGTLNYIWNLLREKIENILKQATLLESQDSKDYVDIDEFCFNYFGVRRKIQGVDVVYLLINSEAYWAIGIDERFLQKKGNSAYIHIQQFAFAMRNHFRSELTSLGFKLLDTFDALHKFAKKNSLSAFCQSTPLIHIFEVTKYLLESKVLDVKYNDVKNLKIILDTTSVYFDYVFPLDWRKILAENMISLRRSDISRRLLHETCLKIGLKGKPAYGAFGRAVMIMLVSGKPSKEFAGIFSKAAEDFPSKELFREIGWEKDNEIPESSSVNASDPNKFLLVLLKICSENWRAYGFISPNCFLYQVELLLLRSSFTRELFFTTKSSLVKWIIGGDSYFGDDVRLLMDDVYAFLATIIVKFIFGRQEVTEWIKKSGLNFNSYYPLLLLRLVVTLCLLCANCNKYFHILFHFLEKDDLTTWLPRDFIDVLKRKKGKNYLIMNANKNMKILAEALMKVGDPLFIVSTSKNRCNLNCPLAIFVDRNSASCKDNVLKILFSKKSEVLQGQDVEAEASNDNNCKSGRIMFTSREETTSDFFMTSKQVSALKEKFQGYEALDKDDWKQLTSALDNGELDMSVSIMHMTMGKQLAITGDPAIKAFMDDWIKYITKENDASISRKDRNNSHNAETTGSSSKGKRNEKEDTNIDSENKGKGKSKSNKEKDG